MEVWWDSNTTGLQLSITSVEMNSNLLNFIRTTSIQKLASNLSEITILCVLPVPESMRRTARMGMFLSLPTQFV